MDRIDRNILLALQERGRLTLAEIADRVRLSVSSSHRRLRALETSGAITGYRAVINPSAVGLDFEALVFVTMRSGEKATLTAFEEGVAELPDVVSAQRLFGEPDYLLRILVADLAAFQRLYDEHLAGLPGVGNLRSTLVMRTVVEDRGVPL